uniref:Uncharacterized protein n=1 Tax=Faecalibaculum rodentium TaxID=1702221 RepID=A0A140DRV3_9FIRM|nr:hypothetical protein AALO17_02460 [Faecalibaculum rodentium]
MKRRGVDPRLLSMVGPVAGVREENKDREPMRNQPPSKTLRFSIVN